MAIVEMRRLTLIGMNSDKDRILRDLMKFGVVDIIDLQQQDADETLSVLEKDGNQEEVAQLENELARIRGALDFLSPYRVKQKKSLFAPRRQVSVDEMAKTADRRQELMEAADRVYQYVDRLNRLKNEVTRLESDIASLGPWRDYPLPLEETRTKSTVIVTGTFPASVNEELLRLDLMENAAESSLYKIGQDKDYSYFYIIYHRSLEGVINEILKKYDFSRVIFRGMAGTVEENIARCRAGIEELNVERKLVESQIQEIAALADDLEVLYDYFSIETEKRKALFNIVRTSSTFILQGWLPADQSENVKAKLEKKWDCIVELREPRPDEDYPILLRNNAFVKPFEMITRFYNLPKPGTFDPSAVMAPFFCMFFGLMLGDAGYGIVLTIAGAIMLRKYKTEGIIRDIFGLMFYCGISTFFWGAMFGSWFGNFFDILFNKTPAIPPLWFIPLDDPMRMLMWSMIFGAVHVFTAMAAQIYMLVKRREYFAAIFDVGSWYLVLIGVVLFAVGGAVGPVGKYMALTGVLMLVLTQGRHKKGLFSKLFSGILSLYNITGYFGDVLSYSRLLALGLATGVVANVINIMGALPGRSVFGFIVLFIVFLVGQTFNLAINLLGSYVHASRLQYVEFFGRFYESGGKVFKPFKRITKYTNIKDEEDN